MKPVGYSSFIEDYQVDGETDHSVKSFQRSLTEPDTGVTTVDISNSQDNSIIAWFNSNTKTIYWYSNVPKVYTTDAFEMFAGLEGLESLDLSGINFYYTVTIYSDNVTEDSTQFVSAPQESFVFNNSTQAMTLEQMEPLSSAIIIDGGQGVTNGQGWFKLVALSDVPEVETYIRVVYKYTVDDNQSSIDSAAAYAQQAQAALQSIESLTTHMKYYPVTISTLIEDNSNENYPYKYIVPMTGVAETDWVDASWVTDQDWAVEAANNQVILHFSQNITDPIVVTIYWTSCSLYTAS